jgi:hypothetical protein
MPPYHHPHEPEKMPPRRHPGGLNEMPPRALYIEEC